MRRPPRSTLFPNATLFRSPRRASWLATTAPLSRRAASGVANARSQQPGPSTPAIGHSDGIRSEEHTSELQARQYLLCPLVRDNKSSLAHTPARVPERCLVG